MRQYIGARYTPKFMGLYDNTTAYEALSVVDNGMGTNYISRIPTPPNTPLTDTTYWLVYGSSNGAILDLQGRMTTVENDLTDNVHPDLTSLGTRMGAAESFITNNVYPRLAGKTITVVGDSISAGDKWVSVMSDILDGIATVVNKSQSGRLLADVVGHWNDILDNADSEIIVIELGVNDWASNVQISSWNNMEADSFNYNVYHLYDELLDYYDTNHKPYPQVIFITPIKECTANPLNTRNLTLDVYRKVITGFCKASGANWINGDMLPILSNAIKTGVNNYYQYDGIHPSPNYSDIMGQYLTERIAAGGDNSDSGSDGRTMTIDTGSLVFNFWVNSTGNVSFTIEGIVTSDGSGQQIISTINKSNAALFRDPNTTSGNTSIPVNIFVQISDYGVWTGPAFLLLNSSNQVYLDYQLPAGSGDIRVFANGTIPSSALIFNRIAS